MSGRSESDATSVTMFATERYDFAAKPPAACSVAHGWLDKP
jgi:hypothetical protein